MDTIQLALGVKKDRYTRGVFQRVYPSDKLPTSVSSYPALIIVNVDTSDKPGTHCVAFSDFTKETTTSGSDIIRNRTGEWGGGNPLCICRSLLISSISTFFFCFTRISEGHFILCYQWSGAVSLCHTKFVRAHRSPSFPLLSACNFPEFTPLQFAICLWFV